ncbi:unnamed protein product [Brugia pahangi]|uniref:Uncharacterized protein n=1 Tax=Brugia pahangi TaxID=6280 RepID=A0A0N4TQG1_BRUPA|nr:unnamed protein product [Brugia pahangi]
MPPQKSLIAELLKKQTKVEYELSVDPHAQESSYYNLDLHVGDEIRLPQSTNTTFSSTSDQFSPTCAENTQKTIYHCPLSNTNIFSEFLELSDSGSAELPTGGSRDSLNSHNAFEIFAWNQKKKWENPGETNTYGIASEYCYCSNNSQAY